MELLRTHARRVRGALRGAARAGLLAWLRAQRERGMTTTPFFDPSSPTPRQLGRRLSAELFALEREYHDRILAEPSAEARVRLYVEANHAIKTFKAAHLPERKDYGFDARYIEAHAMLFGGKLVADFGCGYGLSTACLGRYARSVIGLDCARLCIDTAAQQYAADPKLRFVYCPTLLLPLQDGEVDAMYSNDVLEHLHPDDARTHLREALRVLRPGGVYLLYTPDAASGPHDMTKAFWPRGAGFSPLGAHLHEYSAAELASALRAAGFASVEHPDPRAPTLVLARKAS